jgi:hypothetical protein
VRNIFRQRVFWANAAGAFCNAYPLYFTITWLPFYLVHEQHLAMANMVRIAALYYTIDAAAALATGWATDFWIRQGRGVTVVRKSAMAVGWGTSGIGFLGCSYASPSSYLAWSLRCLGLHPDPRRSTSSGKMGNDLSHAIRKVDANDTKFQWVGCIEVWIPGIKQIEAEVE